MKQLFIIIVLLGVIYVIANIFGDLMVNTMTGPRF